MSYPPVIRDWVGKLGRRWGAAYIRTGRTDADRYFEMMVACGGSIVQNLHDEARQGFDAALAERNGGAR